MISQRRSAGRPFYIIAIKLMGFAEGEGQLTDKNSIKSVFYGPWQISLAKILDLFLFSAYPDDF